jgi:hypothetical protein
VTKIPDKYVRVTSSVVVPLYASRTLTAVVYPASAFDKSVTWEPVKNEGIVEKLTDDGLGTASFKGLKSGRAVFKVSTAGGRWALCTLTVKLVRYASLSVTPSSKTVEKGKTYEIKLKLSPAYVPYPDVEITSSDDAMATVALTDGKWIVTGVGRGYAKIYVKADSGRVNRTLTVRVLDYENPVTVTVSAIGDVMLGGDPRKDSFTRFENLWKNGASYFFAKIKDEMKGVAFANLEIPLIDTTYKMQGSRSYIFRWQSGYASALPAGSIDAVDLDNHNHGLYLEGLFQHADPRFGQGVGSFGLGKVLYITRTRHQDRLCGLRPETVSTTPDEGHRSGRCNPAATLVIASFHWGTDTGIRPGSRSLWHARDDAGADLVVGPLPT